MTDVEQPRVREINIFPGRKTLSHIFCKRSEVAHLRPAWVFKTKVQMDEDLKGGRKISKLYHWNVKKPANYSEQ